MDVSVKYLVFFLVIFLHNGKIANFVDKAGREGVRKSYHFAEVIQGKEDPRIIFFCSFGGWHTR